jgi:hypothetical protein
MAFLNRDRRPSDRPTPNKRRDVNARHSRAAVLQCERQEFGSLRGASASTEVADHGNMPPLKFSEARSLKTQIKAVLVKVGAADSSVIVLAMRRQWLSLMAGRTLGTAEPSSHRTVGAKFDERPLQDDFRRQPFACHLQQFASQDCKTLRPQDPSPSAAADEQYPAVCEGCQEPPKMC